MESFDLALLILRLWLGSVMLAHGINHARNLDGTASWFATRGFRRADLNARGSAFGEIAIGLALIAGLLTAPAAAGLIATMTVAFGSSRRRRSGSWSTGPAWSSRLRLGAGLHRRLTDAAQKPHELGRVNWE